MNDAGLVELSRLARRCGLQEHWTDAHQQPRRVAPDALRKLLAAFGLHCDTTGDIAASHALLDEMASQANPLLVGRAGHALSLPGWQANTAELISEEHGATQQVTLYRDDQGVQLRLPVEPGYYVLRQRHCGTQRVAVTPRAPAAAELLERSRSRGWGVMAQVYSLRQTHADPVRGTCGHGDLATVASLAQALGNEGADVLALNPLHAMFSANPAACSPYSPSNRLFLNVLYGAPALVLGESPVRHALASLPCADGAALEQNNLIDWPRAAVMRLRLLRQLHRRFPQMDAALQRDYDCFCLQHGQRLRDHAVFEVLHAVHPQPDAAWQTWDVARRDPRSRWVREFADDHAREVDFHCFAQWIVTASLKRAQTDARRSGMGIGLLSDLAVGVSPAGSQVWSEPDCFLRGVSIGAPPDILQPLGQSWALAPLSPLEMRRRAYAPFIDVLRTALAYTGGTRIDHILGMARQWLVPEGESPAAGAYLQLPAEALLGLIALEAWRHRSLVIGENLGTVPAGFDERLKAHGVAGMNVLWFMRESSASTAPFLNPSDWPADAAALTTTHDLPTLTGWWRATDIDQQEAAGRLSDSEPADRLRQARDADKLSLWRRMGGQTPLPAEAPLPAMLTFVASAPCALMLTALEDLAGIGEAPNVPGTTTEFPNWRRRLPGDTIAALATSPWRDRVQALRLGREEP